MEIPLLHVPVNGNPVCQSYQSKAHVHVTTIIKAIHVQLQLPGKYFYNISIHT